MTSRRLLPTPSIPSSPLHVVAEQAVHQLATCESSGDSQLPHCVPPYSSSDQSDAAALLTQEAGAFGPRYQASIGVTSFGGDHQPPGVEPTTQPDAVREPHGGVHMSTADDVGHLQATSVEADSSLLSAACCLPELSSSITMADSTSPPSIECTPASVATPSVVPPEEAATIAARFASRAQQLKADLARARAIADACTSAASFDQACLDTGAFDMLAASTSPSTSERKRSRSPQPAAPDAVPSSVMGSTRCSLPADGAFPRKLLHVFSGPGGRIDGLRAMMWDLYQIEVVEIDTLIDPAWCDLTDDVVVEDLLQRIHAGEFFSTIIGTPCGTFSVARIRRPGVVDDGPPQMRDKERPEGIDGLAPGYAAQLEISNTLVKRTVQIARAVRAVGGSVIIENPVTRSDSSSPLYRWIRRSHASLWMHELMVELAEVSEQ